MIRENATRKSSRPPESTKRKKEREREREREGEREKEKKDQRAGITAVRNGVLWQSKCQIGG